MFISNGRCSVRTKKAAGVGWKTRVPRFPCLSLSLWLQTQGPRLWRPRLGGRTDAEKGREWPTGRVPGRRLLEGTVSCLYRQCSGQKWVTRFTCWGHGPCTLCSSSFLHGLGLPRTAETRENSQFASRLHTDLARWGPNPRLREAPRLAHPTAGTPSAPAYVMGLSHSFF